MTSLEKTFVPPITVAKNAEKGLKFHHEFNKGGTDVGIERAHQLKSRHPLTEKDIIHIASYFARHEVDKKALDFGNEDHPSKGYIAWLLWGGDEGRKWVDEIKKSF